MNPEATKTIVEACRAGAASFDPNTVWWEMFWSAADIGAVVLTVVLVVTVVGIWLPIWWASR